jgi:hypothetical protein
LAHFAVVTSQFFSRVVGYPPVVQKPSDGSQPSPLA